MEQAVAYIRVSHQRQVTDGNSLETQEEQVKDYIDRFGYGRVKIFIERGESAKTDDRTVLQEMLSYLKAHKGQVQVVVIPRIDRLARNVYDYANLKLRLQSLGVRLESISERIEDTPVGRFTETVLASAAQFDNEVRAERSKGGMIQAVKDGRWMWQAPFGYKNVRQGAGGKKRGIGTIAPHPVEAQMVKEAFDRLAFGRRSGREVLQWLNVSGVRLSRSAFHRMIHNKAYIGIIEAFGGMHNAAPPFVPLVSTEVFFKAQGQLQRTRQSRYLRPYQRDNPDFPLRGTLRCACGVYFTSSWSRGSKGTLYAHYRCPNCRKINLNRVTVEQRFLAELAKFRPSRDRLNLIEADLRQRLRGAAEEKHAERSRIDGQIESIRKLQKTSPLRTPKASCRTALHAVNSRS